MSDRKNPWSLQSNTNTLILLTDLQGYIFHIIGNSRILNFSHKRILGKNLFIDFLTPETLYQLYDEYSSFQVLPDYINERQSRCTFLIKDKNSKSKRLEKQYDVTFVRSFIEFSNKVNEEFKVEVKQYQDYQIPNQESNSTILKQAILAIIQSQQSSQNKKVNQQSEDQQEGQIKNQIKLEINIKKEDDEDEKQQMLYQSKNEEQQQQCEQIFITPKKQKRIQQGSTIKPSVDRSK